MTGHSRTPIVLGYIYAHHHAPDVKHLVRVSSIRGMPIPNHELSSVDWTVPSIDDPPAFGVSVLITD